MMLIWLKKASFIAGQVKCWFTRTNSCVSASIRRPCHAENISSASVNLYHFRSKTTIPFDLYTSHLKQSNFAKIATIVWIICLTKSICDLIYLFIFVTFISSSWNYKPTIFLGKSCIVYLNNSSVTLFVDQPYKKCRSLENQYLIAQN